MSNIKKPYITALPILVCPILQCPILQCVLYYSVSYILPTSLLAETVARMTKQEMCTIFLQENRAATIRKAGTDSHTVHTYFAPHPTPPQTKKN